MTERLGHEDWTPPLTARWELEITIDDDQYQRVAPPGLAHPDERLPVRVALFDDEVRVGRDRAGHEFAVSLDKPLVDPGVSRHHYTFERLPDGRNGVPGERLVRLRPSRLSPSAASPTDAAIAGQAGTAAAKN